MLKIKNEAVELARAKNNKKKKENQSFGRHDSMAINCKINLCKERC